MKKMLLLVLSVVVLSLTGCSEKEEYDQINVEDYTIEEIAKMYVENLLSEEYEQAYQIYPHHLEMEKATSARFYKATMNSIFNQYGEVTERGEHFTTEVDEWEIVSFPTKFETGEFNINVVFDEDKNIAGFNFGEYGLE